MRWSIVRLIWLRELRDQLRDRRTVFMIAILPIFLYPLAGIGLAQLARGFLGQRSIIGIVGLENLHPWPGTFSRPTSAVAVSCFACTPPPPGCPGGLIAHVSAAGALALGQPQPWEIPGHLAWLELGLLPPGGAGAMERVASTAGLALSLPPLDYPPLIAEENGKLVFKAQYQESSPLLGDLQILNLPGDLSAHRSWLDDRKIDLLLVVPPTFQSRLFAGELPELFLYSREKDETSLQANARVSNVLYNWRRDLRKVRLARLGLPGNIDQTFRVTDPEREKSATSREEANLFNVLVRIFPFVLVMWSLAGALYPAVDLCAGEKERGTMETLLISPASRDEIVWGKFLTIWVFSASTALLNLLSMALTTWQLAMAQPGGAFSFGALLWGVFLLMPLSAFFSAVCLAVGAYARSSKEGQYYLMPLFLLTMPLIFLTLAPGVELNPFYSMVPVTGVALLLQRLVAIDSADRVPWFYFLPVLAPMVIYSWLALRWAIGQFQREEVLFREAERLDLGLWLKRMLREKEPMPSAGEAMFCFGLILMLRWISFGLGHNLSLLTRTGIGQVAFVLTPPLFMALLLTTRPWQGLGFRLPPLWAWPAAGVLALLVIPPLVELTVLILKQFPELMTLMELDHPLTRELRALSRGYSADQAFQYILVLAVFPAICEEIAFRGFILHGLQRNFRPWPAILLSAFLFSLYQMNVFQFVPHFVFGMILGLIAVRTGSVLPSILFHLIYNTLVIAPMFTPSFLLEFVPSPDNLPEITTVRLIFASVCAALAGVALAALWWLGPQATRPEMPDSQQGIPS